MYTYDLKFSVKHVKRMFNPKILIELRKKLAILQQRSGGALSERDKKMRLIGASQDSIRLQKCWYDIWHNPSQVLLDAVGAFTYVTYPLQIRHVEKLDHIVPWHQDIGYMRLLPRMHKEIITCWVPVENNPSLHSSLEFAPGRWPELQHHSGEFHGAYIDKTFNNAISFNLSLGDAIVFGDHVPHRTLMSNKLFRTRRSFEIRLTKPEHALPGKDYFNVLSGKFIKTQE